MAPVWWGSSLPLGDVRLAVLKVTDVVTQVPVEARGSIGTDLQGTRGCLWLLQVLKQELHQGWRCGWIPMGNAEQRSRPCFCKAAACSKMESCLEEKIWAVCFSSAHCCRRTQTHNASQWLWAKLVQGGELKCKFKFGSSVACLHSAGQYLYLLSLPSPLITAHFCYFRSSFSVSWGCDTS